MTGERLKSNEECVIRDRRNGNSCYKAALNLVEFILLLSGTSLIREEILAKGKGNDIKFHCGAYQTLVLLNSLENMCLLLVTFPK